MGSIRSFMFHDIRDSDKTKYPKRYDLKSFLSEDQFKFQISLIESKYRIISSLDVKDVNLGSNIDYAVLTFDDGLMDHYNVYKYLKSKKISGTFLVPRMPLVENKLMNTHKVQFILASVDNEVISNEILDLFEDKDFIWEKYSRTKWKNNWWTKDMIFVTNFLRSHSDDVVNNYDFTDYLFGKYVTKDELKFSKDLYLSIDQLEEMSRSNMVMGGHGDISENLLLISDYKSDINRSRDFISDYSDQFVFSYPNGGYNEDIKNHMIDIDCYLSYTTNPMTLTDLDEFDYLEFPRYDSPQKIKLS